VDFVSPEIDNLTIVEVKIELKQGTPKIKVEEGEKRGTDEVSEIKVEPPNGEENGGPAETGDVKVEPAKKEIVKMRAVHRAAEKGMLPTRKTVRKYCEKLEKDRSTRSCLRVRNIMDEMVFGDKMLSNKTNQILRAKFVVSGAVQSGDCMYVAGGLPSPCTW